jgi:hypothetical protein
MSPTSQNKRKKTAKMERDNMSRKIRKYEHTLIPLNEEQSEELCGVGETIETDGASELQLLFKEGEEHGVGQKLREVWQSDKQSDQVQFKNDQKQNRTGKKCNKWSYITIQMALAIFTRSPAAYEALKSFNILQLPSRSTLQAYTGAFLHQPGTNNECISDQVVQYLIHCRERERGKKKSEHAGVLVFVEVKVISRLLWNSRSQTLIGLSMGREEMSTLSDVYQVMVADRTQTTSYIFQFLWRDLTGDFDIIGLYFTSSATLKSKYIISCVLETLKLFQCHSLITLVIVCDGASVNLTAIKASHGHYGSYPVMIDEGAMYEVEPYMINPFDPPNRLYCSTT